MNAKRMRVYKETETFPGPVVYWMSRDQRVHDHWGLAFAQKLALKHQSPLCVVFSLVPDFLGATLRQYDFMLKGLAEVEETLRNFQIPFFVLTGAADQTLPPFLKQNNLSVLVTDFNPLKIHQKWMNELKKNISVPIYQVDAHNIVPCWVASPKQEYAAYTLRPKINRLLPEFLEPFTDLQVHPYPWSKRASSTDWTELMQNLKVNRNVTPVEWLKPGEKAGREMLKEFLQKRLPHYDAHRNDPLKNAISNLSPYLHFGQLSPQRVALAVQEQEVNMASKESFLEELIIRRELSDNFCFYNPHYDQPDSFSNWARKSLAAHLKDEREYLYELEELESASTHDDLWNACQLDMMKNGKLHGYLRMYWAKKILEWSASPEEAQQHAIHLNDKYFLDGRDPNGYAGIAWSIGGVHDRAWFERPIFGKVRYMNKNGCKRKFNVDAYISSIASKMGLMDSLSR